MIEPPELLTVDEVAALMRTTPDSIRDRVKRNTIPAECVIDAVKPMLFRAVALRAWLGLSAAPDAAGRGGA